MDQFINQFFIPVLSLITMIFLMGSAWYFFTGKDKKESTFTKRPPLFSLLLDRPHPKPPREMKVYQFPKNAITGLLLHLTWESFGKGIENLVHQLEAYQKENPKDQFDLCIGINDAGVVMATFLNFAAFGRKKIGYIRYQDPVEGEEYDEESSLFPKIQSETPKILLVDFELKSGSILGDSVKRVKKKYPSSEIYFAVFGATTKGDDLKINSLEQLEAGDIIERYGIKDFFLACTMHSPGIEPPYKLR